MKVNRAKMRMQSGQVALGAVLGMGSAEAAAAMARHFDFLLIDAQHGNWSIESAWEAFRRTVGAGGIPLVRVFQNDPFAIGSMLDRGALGIVVPMVETAEEARAVADAARFGPKGRRSVGGGGMRSWLPVSNEEINDEVFVAVQIETKKGVENAEAILSVDGIDGCWIGPDDLALSMDVDRSTDQGRGEHEAAIRSVIQTAQKVGKIPGIATPGPNNQWLEAGCLFVTVGSDGSCIGRGAAATMGAYSAYRPS